jgi:hypothetical protein
MRQNKGGRELRHAITRSAQDLRGSLADATALPEKMRGTVGGVWHDVNSCRCPLASSGQARPPGDGEAATRRL